MYCISLRIQYWQHFFFQEPANQFWSNRKHQINLAVFKINGLSAAFATAFVIFHSTKARHCFRKRFVNGMNLRRRRLVWVLALVGWWCSWFGVDLRTFLSVASS